MLENSQRRTAETMQVPLEELLLKISKCISCDREPKDDEHLNLLETVNEAREKLQLYASSIMWREFCVKCKILTVVSDKDDCTAIPDKLNIAWKKLAPWVLSREFMVESLLNYHVYQCLKALYSTKCPNLPDETRIHCLRVSEHQSSHLLQRFFWPKEPTHMLMYTPAAIRNFVIRSKSLGQAEQRLEDITRVLLCFDIVAPAAHEYNAILTMVSEMLFRHKENFVNVPLNRRAMEITIEYVKCKRAFAEPRPHILIELLE